MKICFLKLVHVGFSLFLTKFRKMRTVSFSTHTNIPGDKKILSYELNGDLQCYNTCHLDLLTALRTYSYNFSKIQNYASIRKSE